MSEENKNLKTIESGNTEVAQTQVFNPVMVALEKGLEINIIEKMVELQYKEEERQAKRAFYEALSGFQSEVPAIDKNGKASFATKNGGKMEYNFARLEDIANAIKPILPKYGLSYRFEGEQSNGFITITCIVSHKLGHQEKTVMNGAPDATGNKNLIQQIASTRKYLQRYTLTEALGIVVGGEDDDAMSVAEKVAKGDFYPQEEFEKNFPQWELEIKKGTKPESVVKYLNDKNIALSEDQLSAIYGVKA